MIGLTGDSHLALAVDVRVWGRPAFSVFACYRLVTCPVSTGHSYSHFTQTLKTGRCHCTTAALCKYELKYVLIISHRKCLGAATDTILSQHLHLMTPCSWMQPLPVTNPQKNCLTLQFPPALWVSFSISRLVALALQVLNLIFLLPVPALIWLRSIIQPFKHRSTASWGTQGNI